jgi:hypothetical protein
MGSARGGKLGGLPLAKKRKILYNEIEQMF